MKKKFLLTTVLLALLGGGVYAGSGYAIKPLATQFIRQSGFPEANISSISMIPSGVMIEKISLDGYDFSTVDNIVISLNWMDFFNNRKINSVEIKDISITAELDADGHLKIAGWDATLPKSNTSSGLFPIQSLLLHGVTVDLDTPQGDIRLQGKMSLETPTSSEQNIEYALWGQQHQLSFDAKGSGKILSNGDINLSTTLNEGRLNLPNIELSRASGEISFKKSNQYPAPHITGKLLAGKINTLGALLQNVVINLDTQNPESLTFKTSPAGFKDIEIEGKWITSEDSYLHLTLTSLKTLDVIEVLYPDEVKNFKPWVTHSNPMSLSMKVPICSLRTEKKKASFSLSLGKKDLDMNFLTSGSATYTPQNQETNIQLEKTEFQIAGGKITSSPFTLQLKNSEIAPLALTLSVQSVNMTELSQLADIDGLSVEGYLSGTIPLTYSDKGIVFGDGVLTSDSDGLFAYKPANFPPSFQGDDERMQIVRDALSNFKFSKLSFDVSGAFDKKMKTTLTAEGKNPALGDRPIKLNLNLDGDLGAVIKQTLQAGDIADKIRSK